MDTATLERPATPPAERNVIGGREVEAASGRTQCGAEDHSGRGSCNCSRSSAHDCTEGHRQHRFG